MAFSVRSKGRYVSVRTHGLVTFQERVSIIDQLLHGNGDGGYKGIFVNHKHARFDMTIEAVANFGQHLAKIQLYDDSSEINVIASPENRAIIDMSVMSAANAGLSIHVCESRDEAISRMAAKSDDCELLRWLVEL